MFCLTVSIRDIDDNAVFSQNNK